MPDPLLLAIDVGTGSVRAALLDARGAIVALAAREHDQHVPRFGWSEQSPADWWRGVVETVRAVLRAPEADPRRIAGVAACGQMHAPVPVDAAGGVLLERVQLWNDKRPAELCARFEREHDARALLPRTANPPAPSWTAFKVAWMRDHQPEVYGRAAFFLTPKDFVNFRLTGVAATDYSEASGSYLLDARELRYDAAIADLVGVDVARFPPVHPADAVIGTVTPAAAAEKGLPAGLPVVAGGGDFLVALLGSGVVEPGVGSDVTGTSTLISVWDARPVADARVMNLHAAGDGWVPFTILDAGGDSLRWARRVFGEPGTSFDAINRLAEAAPPGCEGLLFLPYLNGERVGGRPDARAQFFGVTARHGKGHFYRAVMGGVALASKRNLDLMAAAGAPIGRVVATGGGARGSLWLRIKASVYGVPITAPENTESGLLGCAALAGAGVGLFADPRDAARRLVRLAPPVEPDPALAERY
ncbi:MAG TPA: FGGY family carbohydrate kinase, partial [Geminicoccaceae bacterium]|nr:FGGY family carbohydrate kinase [Geminicoccaceae bacterium]